MLLVKLLDNNWKEDYISINQEDAPNTGLNLLHILTTSLHQANCIDPGDFVFETQLDVKKSKTYKRAIGCFYALQWAHAIQEEVDQIKRNKAWKLVLMSKIKARNKQLSSKWVFKVKRDVNGNIVQFKAR